MDTAATSALPTTYPGEDLKLNTGAFLVSQTVTKVLTCYYFGRSVTLNCSTETEGGRFD